MTWEEARVDEGLPLVSVRGEALLDVDPETAALDVLVSARDRDRDRTLARLHERSAAVHAVLEEFGVERTETVGLRVAPELKSGRGHERVEGYTGSVRHLVTVTDFTTLGDLVVRLAEPELVDVMGPWWRLRPDSPVYRHAREEATRDAVTRAREYAEAVGSHLVALVALADVGLLSEPQGYPMAPAAAMPMPMRAMGAPGAPTGAPIPPPPLELDPMRQTVRASVEARFQMAAVPPERLA